MASAPESIGSIEAAAEVSKQENVSPRNQVARQGSTKQQIRHRASVACASCRERRIRCVVPKGQVECTQCKRTGTECVIKNDDERRRPISKAYMSSLSDRIALLEGLLAEKGVEAPPAAHPPKTRHEAPGDKQQDSSSQAESQAKTTQNLSHSPLGEVPSPPDSANEDFNMHDSDQADSSTLANSQFLQPLPKETSPFRMLDPKQEDIVHRLLSTTGNLSFDQLSGRLRFFGPTANSHIYAESLDQSPFDSREPPEQVRRAERIIRSLTSATHDYLMNNFWEYYNSVMRIIHQEAFEADRESQNPKFYSSFLHIAILAMGFRFADFDREDMKRITLASRESTLHREAKYMLDIELERPGGIPSVQALLLLGDLECGVGRDNTGWMYSGMANRLAFDIGLHLDCRTNGISEIEVEIRHMAMRACVIYDKYWALFLGRPTSIKNQDIGMDLLSKRFSQLSSLMGGGGPVDKKAVIAEIYEQLMELMELAGRIVETRENNRVSGNLGGSSDQGVPFNTAEGEDNAYLHVINLDRQLQNWYRRLPDHLQWKPANIKTAPYSFFLLHQQYHVSMILLHRPWARYGTISDGASTGSHPSPESGVPDMPRELGGDHAAPPFGSLGGAHTHTLGMGDPHSMVDDSRTSLSRSICTQQAIRVARIFWQHRQRFDGTKIFVTGIQHAGTAAIALIAALAYHRSDADRRTYLGYLEILSSAVSDMSHTYHPAARMDELLRAVIAQLRADISDPTGAARAAAPPLALTGSDRSILSESGWRGNMDNIYSVLPMRRESAAIAGEGDLDQLRGMQSHKRRRPGTNSRRASEFTRPTPPFYAPAQPTPPKSCQSQSSQSYGAAAVDPALYTLDGQAAAAAQAAQGGFSLDFLGGSAVDGDMDEGIGRPSDDFVLVGGQTDGWGGGGMGRAQDGYDSMPMAEWMSGPAGLSASSVLGGGATPGMLPHGGMFRPDEAPRGMHSSGHEKGTGEEHKSGGGMEWMGSEGGMNALSPVSLSGLVQTVGEKADGGEGREHEGGGGPSRNHELDFFSF